MLNLKLDNMQELTYQDRKRVHNLKYYTWVEQQGKTVEELNALWYDTEGHLGRRPQGGQGSGRPDQRLQRGDGPSEEPVKRRRAGSRPALPFDSDKEKRHETRPVRQMRQVRQDLCRRPGSHHLRVRRHSGHRLRLRLHQDPADKGEAGGPAGPHHVALPGAAAGGAGDSQHPLRVGWSPCMPSPAWRNSWA